MAILNIFGFNADKTKAAVATKADLDALPKIAIDVQEIEVTVMAGSWNYKAVTVPNNTIAVIPVVKKQTGGTVPNAIVFINDQSGSATTKLVNVSNQMTSKSTVTIEIYSFYRQADE